MPHWRKPVRVFKGTANGLCPQGFESWQDFFSGPRCQSEGWYSGLWECGCGQLSHWYVQRTDYSLDYSLLTCVRASGGLQESFETQMAHLASFRRRQ